MKSILVAVILILGIISCKNENKEATKEQEKNDSNSATPMSGPANTLPFIPIEEYKALAQTTNGIDVIPYGTSVTMNISEPSSCYQFIATHILDTQVAEIACTQPQGKIFFNKNGDSFMEADIYFNEKCKYLIFFKSGETKPKYATQISEKGMEYFSKLFSADAMNELQKLQRSNNK